uniref:Uncharacterized protein n=1 Tax=Rousettus aegyptiacus TaxID=9407 RepID=A0A7J8KB15_ROUAE|nr:hypothetical protein HJG63_007849 [Rousettus aegyptiacus]
MFQTCKNRKHPKAVNFHTYLYLFRFFFFSAYSISLPSSTKCLILLNPAEMLFSFRRLTTFPLSVHCSLNQGSSTPGPQTCKGQWPVMNWTSAVAEGQVSKQSFIYIWSRSSELASPPQLYLRLSGIRFS